MKFRVLKESQQTTWLLDDALAQAIEITKRFGYITKAKSWDYACESTGSILWHILNKSIDVNTGALLYEAFPTSAATYTAIDEIKAFYKSLPGKTAFISRLKKLLTQEHISKHEIGLIAPILGIKLRLERKLLDVAARKNSEYLGHIGEHITFQSIAECICKGEGSYGSYFIYRMQHNNNELIWKTSVKIDTDCPILVNATIKDHQDYKGIKQTCLTRCKVEYL